MSPRRTLGGRPTHLVTQTEQRQGDFSIDNNEKDLFRLEEQRSDSSVSCVYEFEASYLFLFEIWNTNNDVDDQEEEKNNNNHAVHLFFVCSLIFVEYLEHACTVVHVFIAEHDQLTNSIASLMHTPRHLPRQGHVSHDSRRSSHLAPSETAQRRLWSIWFSLASFRRSTSIENAEIRSAAECWHLLLEEDRMLHSVC